MGLWNRSPWRQTLHLRNTRKQLRVRSFLRLLVQTKYREIFTILSKMTVFGRFQPVFEFLLDALWRNYEYLKLVVLKYVSHARAQNRFLLSLRSRIWLYAGQKRDGAVGEVRPPQGAPEGRRSPPGGLPEAVRFKYMRINTLNECASYMLLLHSCRRGVGWLRMLCNFQGK